MEAAGWLNNIKVIIKIMKKLLIILFLTCQIIQAQKNTLYGTLSLPDKGLGFRYERNLTNGIQTNDIFGYVGATLGKYTIWYEGNIKHLKIVSGLTYSVHISNFNYTNIFCAGLNYHFYNEKFLDQKVYFPVSFDIGTGARIKRISVLMTYDLLKNDASLNLGFSF
jgi:hypothetical protein